jgi:uncharacterized membrane protein
MKCRLNDNPYADKNFQIEFNSIKEIEELRDSLTSMIKYFNICKNENEDIPELIYRIKNKKNNLKK